MRSKASALLAGAALALSVLAAPAPAGVPPGVAREVASKPLTEERLRADIYLRQMYDLPATEDYVRDLYARAQRGEVATSEDAGTLLTIAEREAIDKITAAVNVIQEILVRYFHDASARADLAAVYVDEEYFGKLIVAVTRRVEEHRAEIMRRIAQIGETSAQVEVRKVAYSAEYLEELADKVSEALLADRIPKGRSVGIDDADNKVVVGSEDPAAARETMNRLFPGQPIRVDHETPAEFVTGAGA